MHTRKRLTTIFLLLLFLIGLSLLAYPTVSDYWNSLHQSRAITQYTAEVAELDNDRYAEVLEAARQYNETLLGQSNRYILGDAALEAYEELLNVGGNGIMGYIEIPSIDCTLSIYHTASEAVLQTGVGHIPGSSLPVGGVGTHAVLSGHRGLPSARLFTDLDKLNVGDTFILHILDEVLTYEVDQILIVDPEEMDALEIDPEQDLCTLVTCTPYGINTHRLLVRGHRVENASSSNVRVTADAIQIEPVIVAPALAVPILLLLLILLLVTTRKKKQKRER
jgi:sortase A